MHEGPQSISHRSTSVPLEPGNVQSNEPGYYEPGEFGIRIENLVEVVKDETVAPRDFLRFETLTLCPIEKRLIDPGLLAASERGWLDAYHARVLDTLGPDLERDDRRWLERACAPLDASGAS